MPLSHTDAAHLLRRVGFAGTAAEIAHFAGRERSDCVDEILAVEPALPSRPDFARRRDVWPGIETFRIWWVDRMAQGRWVERSASTPSPLDEKMTLFWHSHFATGASKVEDLRTVWAQHDLLRRHGRGNFATLLEAVCTNGATLSFLDNNLNTAEEPQENFARELMELYTIGPTQFSENDVIEMTRAWTGHGTIGWVEALSNVDQTYQYNADVHDGGPKTIFGQTAPWNGPDTISLFISGVRQTATARFIAEKIWKYFVNGAPTEAQINEVAATFAAGFDIGALLRATLLHDEFWAAGSRNALVRSPLEFAADLLRRTGISAEDSGISWQMDSMGHSLFDPPNVAGWGTHDYWIGTATMWAKARFAGQIQWQESFWADFDDLLEEPTANAAVDRIVGYFGITEPSQQTQDALSRFYRAYKRRDSWAARNTVVLIAALSPEFQVA